MRNRYPAATGARRYAELRHRLSDPPPAIWSEWDWEEWLHPHTPPATENWPDPIGPQSTAATLLRLAPTQQRLCAVVAARMVVPLIIAYSHARIPQPDHTPSPAPAPRPRTSRALKPIGEPAPIEVCHAALHVDQALAATTADVRPREYAPEIRLLKERERLIHDPAGTVERLAISALVSAWLTFEGPLHLARVAVETAMEALAMQDASGGRPTPATRPDSRRLQRRWRLLWWHRCASRLAFRDADAAVLQAT